MAELEVNPDSAFKHWTTKEIVYISLVGPILIAALLEWLLWLAAFCYCLEKALRKADHWSSRVLSVIMMVLFVFFR